MKVTLINPPSGTKYPQPPMGLALLASIMEIAGHDVRIVDFNVTGEYIHEVYWADLIGVTAVTPTINKAIEIIREIKAMRPVVKIVLGGVHASLLPDDTLDKIPELDCLVIGEGEAYVQILPIDKPLDKLYMSKGIIDMDTLPFMAYHLLTIEKYRPMPPHGRRKPYIPMITSRGCPYSCVFCSKPIFGNKYRAMSPDRVIDEILYYKKRFGVREIAFYDDVFTLNRDRAMEIADNILIRNLNILWTCETRVNLIDSELLSIFKDSGCYSIAYGIESGSVEILQAIDKNITLNQVEEAVRLTHKAGIEVVGYFMMGIPGETKETIRKTIDFAKRLKVDYAQFSKAIPYPGTALASMMGVKEGWENYVYA